MVVYIFIAVLCAVCVAIPLVWNILLKKKTNKLTDQYQSKLVEFEKDLNKSGYYIGTKDKKGRLMLNGKLTKVVGGNYVASLNYSLSNWSDEKTLNQLARTEKTLNATNSFAKAASNALTKSNESATMVQGERACINGYLFTFDKSNATQATYDAINELATLATSWKRILPIEKK